MHYLISQRLTLKQLNRLLQQVTITKIHENEKSLYTNELNSNDLFYDTNSVTYFTLIIKTIQ